MVSSASVTFTSGHTRRAVQGNVDYTAASVWAGAPPEQRSTNLSAARFLEGMKDVRPPEVQMVAYRGRAREEWLPEHPTWKHMGPGRGGGGRYDRPGRPALYLSETREGVLRELAHWRPGREVVVQEFAVPAHALRIADCASDPIPDFIGACFHFAEQATVEGRGPQGDYTFSQLIAQLVAEAGFEGMRVPGVRGGDGIWYANLVLFDSADRWTDWVLADVPPYVIA